MPATAGAVRGNAQRAARPPWRVLAGLVGSAALLHALLLAGVASAGAPAGGGPTPALAMQVRTLPLPEAPTPQPAAAEVAAEVAPALAAPAARVGSRSPSRRTRPPSDVAAAAGSVAVVDADVAVVSRTMPAEVAASAPRRPAETPALAAATGVTYADEAAAGAIAAADTPAAPPAGPVVAALRSADANLLLVAASRATPPTGGEGAAARDDEMPIYKTVFPPPLTLHYDLRRGLLSGTGSLIWRPEGGHYEARLEGRVAGLNVLTQVSQGGFDDAGLAPLRYTDQRLNRDTRAANFQREHGKITFSGPSDEFPLLIGTQDRLSWMIQLAAVVTAEPRRLAPGGKVAIYVVGARADVAMWVFRSVGAETVETAVGPVRAVRFTREAQGPHDTLAEAWLDPLRHGLPVRARIGTGDGGDAVELTLHDLTKP